MRISQLQTSNSGWAKKMLIPLPQLLLLPEKRQPLPRDVPIAAQVSQSVPVPSPQVITARTRNRPSKRAYASTNDWHLSTDMFQRSALFDPQALTSCISGCYFKMQHQSNADEVQNEDSSIVRLLERNLRKSSFGLV